VARPNALPGTLNGGLQFPRPPAKPDACRRCNGSKPQGLADDGLPTNASVPLARDTGAGRVGVRIPLKKISRIEPLNLDWNGSLPIHRACLRCPGQIQPRLFVHASQTRSRPLPLPRRGCGTKPQVAPSFGATWGNDAAPPQPQRGCGSGGQPEHTPSSGGEPGGLHLECSAAGMSGEHSSPLPFKRMKFDMAFPIVTRL
jgi:hypothetical protein